MSGGRHLLTGRLLVISLATVWLALSLSLLPLNASADTNPGPQSGAVGLEATVSSKPPTQAATIALPGNGAVFSDVPITVSGICPKGLLVKLFANNVFVGSTPCSNGSYVLQADLFSGQNDLVARVFDALDQAGPDSNQVSVTFNDAQFAQFGSRVSLTSNYAQRGANPGSELEWPITLSDGTGPYAISVDWGDGTPTDLQSAAAPGVITLKHVYKAAGLYRVLVKATDKNNQTAFLQLVGQANGAIQASASGANIATNKPTDHGNAALWPTLAMIPLIFAAFWIGSRHRLSQLRRFDQ